MERYTHSASRAFYFSLLMIALVGCGESPRVKSESHVFTQDMPADTNAVSARANDNAVVPEFIQVFGNGYLSANASGAVMPQAGFLGNTGGFGFGGSIASLLGNLGGGGLGGFGSFANFFSGNLPISPPGGALPGLGAGGTPPAFGGGFVPPGAGAGAPLFGGGFIPPGAGGGAPPFAGGFNPPGGIGAAPPVGGGFAPPFAGGGGGLPALPFVTNRVNRPGSNVLATGNSGGITLVDVNLTDFSNPLASNLDFVFVATDINVDARNAITPFAVTETVTPCRGGGTTTRTVDDVDPVGFSTGDSRTTLFTNCINRVGGTAVTNGSRKFVANQVQGVPFVDPTWSINTVMTVTNLERNDPATSSSFVNNGSSTTDISSTATTINHNATGNGTTVHNDATGSATATYNFNLTFALDKTASTYNMQLAVSVDTTGATPSKIDVTSPVAFEGAQGQSPRAGQLKLVKSSNGATTRIVVLTAQADGSVQVQTDANGDGVFETTVTQPTWFGVLGQFY